MKKLFAVILVLALALSMVACTSSEEPSAASQPSEQTSVSTPAESSPAAVESEPSATSDGEAVELPDLDGFEKTEQTTMGIDMTMYQAADNSAIIVMKMPGDEDTKQMFADKDAEAEAELNGIIAQQLAQYTTDTEIKGKFETVEGKDAYVFSMTIPEAQAGAAGADIQIDFYMIATSDSIYNVIGTSLGTDVSGGMTQIIQSL